MQWLHEVICRCCTIFYFTLLDFHAFVEQVEHAIVEVSNSRERSIFSQQTVKVGVHASERLWVLVLGF